MSNRTVLEFNHDINWTEDIDGLVKVLNAIRNSAPINDEEFNRRLTLHYGISYIETRHHTTVRIDERLKATTELEEELEDAYCEISELRDELYQLRDRIMEESSSHCLDKT